jgi:hypothetical protein
VAQVGNRVFFAYISTDAYQSDLGEINVLDKNTNYLLELNVVANPVQGLTTTSLRKTPTKLKLASPKLS